MLQEIDDGHVLAAQIRNARQREHGINHRTKSLWLPALAHFAAASVFLFGLTEISRQPTFLVQSNSRFGRSLYIAWITARLLFAATGAFLSRRAGGTRTARIVAGIFASMGMLRLVSVWIPIRAVVEHNAFVLHQADGLAFAVLFWVVAPAVTLFLGTLPFFGTSSLDQARQNAT